MTITLSVAGLERQYLLHEPPTISTARPAVLMLHGAGASAAWARDETHWSRTADQHGFLVAYPDGLAVDPDRPSGFLNNPRVWNAGAGPGLIVNQGPDDVTFLSAVIADLIQRRQADPTRVFITGFSNGAAMTFRFAAERSHEVTAIAPVAGYCPHVSNAGRTVPTLFVVGGEDPLVPILGGDIRSPWDGRIEHRPPLADSLARWATAIGASAFPTDLGERDGVRTEAFSPNFHALVIADLGHHWPGGRGRLARRLAGPPSNRVDANELVWRFFREQRLS